MQGESGNRSFSIVSVKRLSSAKVSSSVRSRFMPVQSQNLASPSEAVGSRLTVATQQFEDCRVGVCLVPVHLHAQIEDDLLHLCRRRLVVVELDYSLEPAHVHVGI